MNYRVILNVLGTVIKFLGISLLAPLLVALYYQEPASIRIFAFSSILTFFTGLLLEKIFRSEFEELSHRESIVIVALGWFMAAMFGGGPFLLAGLSPVDALFESMSGFTTTGSS
ncbi:MAG: TrkH family potassium uptake protein, partial [Euryarchaeota archaeon]|nr:TrkH family potassium uptake protein [Euryarchaeota archaeon]